MSSLSAASALPVTDALAAGGLAGDDGQSGRHLAYGNSRAGDVRPRAPLDTAAEHSARRRLRVLVGALIASLIVHLLGITGAADWLVDQFRWNEPEAGPPMRAVLVPPPPPVYHAVPKTPPPVARPRARPKPKPAEPPMFSAAPTVEAQPAPVESAVISEPAVALPEPVPPPAVAGSAPAATEPAVSSVAAAEPAAEPVPDESPAPTVKVPKRIDLVGTLFAGEKNFMVGTGGFRLRHDGNRYEISVLGSPKGLARLLFTGEFSGVSRGAITPTGLQPSEYTEDRGGPAKREMATLDWEAGVVRLKDDKVAPIEPPMFDRLSVILQFYYRPPEATEMTMRVAGTRNVDTYVFRRLRNETLELPNRTVDAQLWRVNHDNGEPRIDLWMSPEYHYLPLRVRVYARKEFGGRFATLNIDEIRVEE